MSCAVANCIFLLLNAAAAALAINENVLRLDVAMYNPAAVEKPNGRQQLLHYAAHMRFSHTPTACHIPGVYCYTFS
jgi:hypothetical protein